MTDITTHPDDTLTLDFGGETYRAETSATGECKGCAFDDRIDDCTRVDCAFGANLIIWVLQP